MSGGARNVREYVDAIAAGQVHTATLRKIPSQATVGGWWADLSMAAGIPIPNYYASDPLKAAVLNGDRGIFHGAAVSPAKKFLASLAMVGNTAGFIGNYRLLDYLLYYPFIDLDAIGQQDFDNSVALPRYSDGDGVMAMLVAVAPTTGGGSFFFDYIDQNGDAKTSPVISCSTAAASIASIITSEPATAAGGRLFLPLASGSTGIRQVTSMTPLVPNGGLGCLVLVRPLGDHSLREVNVPAEREYISERSAPPEILDGAYLNLVVNTPVTIAGGTVAGRATVTWI